MKRPLTVCLAVVFFTQSFVVCADENKKKSSSQKTTPALAPKMSLADKRFEYQRQRAIDEISRKLAQRAGKTAAESWYIIAFCDMAAQAEYRRIQPFGTRGYWTYEVRKDVKYRLVQGNAAAAAEIHAFLSQAPKAATELSDPAFENLRRWEKSWDFRRFQSEREAQAQYDALMAPSLEK